jgi:hypothetical protein
MSNMKILGMGANPFNSRDGIIVEGCKSILNISQFDRYLHIRDTVNQNVSDFYPNEKFDLLVYCGTPWLWDQMQHTPKYRNTMNAIKAHPEAKVVWLGIGSCLYLGDENKGILSSLEDQEMLRTTFQNSTVIVRDSLAHDILNKAGVENHYLPCPSYFFNPVCKTDGDGDVLFYHAPKTGIASGYFDEHRLNVYNRLFLEYYIQYGAKIYVCEKEEIEIAEKLFKNFDVTLLNDPIDTFKACKNARKVLSGRIHNAVPAMVYGAEVGIVPVDSRHRTITDWFDIGINNINDLVKIKTCDTMKLKADYIEVYRKLISGMK